MKVEQIRVGATLRLKPARQEAYDREDPFVRVDEIVPRRGYKTVWVRQYHRADSEVTVDEFFAPSDFAEEVRP